MNKIFLTGNLTRDPEGGEATGVPYARITLAVNDKSGGREKVTYFKCKAFYATATNICRYCHKGDKVGIIGGSVGVEAYIDKNEQPAGQVTCVIQEIEFLKKANTETSGGEAMFQKESKSNAPKQAKLSDLDIDDSDIPF